MKKRICFLASVVACLVFAFAALCACGDNSDKTPKTTATLSSTSITLVKAESAELTVTVSDLTIDVAWEIENPGIAVMTTKGKTATVKGMAAGTTKINVKNKASGEILASCEVTVTLPKLFINLPYGLVLRGAGSVATVQAIATEELEGDISWELSNDTYAMVEYQGLIARVTAKRKGQNSEGDAILTVYYGDVSASIPVYVGVR